MNARARIRLDRLRLWELIMLAASVALIIDMVAFPWYSVRTEYSVGRAALGPFSANYSPGRVFTILTPLAIVCVMLVWVICIVQVAQRGPAIPIVLTVFGTVLNLILGIGLLIRVVFDQPVIPVSGANGANTIKPDVASVVGLFLALVMLYAGWRSLRTDGIAAADQPPKIETLRLAARSR
jgi:hypothetical protein